MEIDLRDMADTFDVASASAPNPRRTEVPVAFVLASGNDAIAPDALNTRCEGRAAGKFYTGQTWQ